jgi:DNA-binding NarL/FixJ family response regulator
LPRVLKESPTSKVIMYSSTCDEKTVSAAFIRGALGFVRKTLGAVLPVAVRSVAAGTLFLQA